MSGAGRNKPEGLLGLTQGEARLILLGVLCSDPSGKVDFEKLATKAPYKNVASASTSYRQAKRRFTSLNESGPAGSETSTPAGTSVKALPVKRKRAPAAIDPGAANGTANGDGDAIAEAEDEASPTAKPKAKRQRKALAKKDVVVKTEEVESDQSVLSSPPPSLVPYLEPEPEPEQQDPIKNHTHNPDPNPNDSNSSEINTNTNTIPETKENPPTDINLRSEEEEVMTDLDLDAEFTAMEETQKLTGVRGGSAWLGSVPLHG
ncbi:hypothetical protein BDV06DRAFT_54813 [Aspergillus oleicola]